MIQDIEYVRLVALVNAGSQIEIKRDRKFFFRRLGRIYYPSVYVTFHPKDPIDSLGIFLINFTMNRRVHIYTCQHQGNEAVREQNCVLLLKTRIFSHCILVTFVILDDGGHTKLIIIPLYTVYRIR